MKKIAKKKLIFYKKFILGFGSITLLSVMFASTIACTLSPEYQKKIPNTKEKWDDKYVMEDGSNNLPTTQEGSNFVWVYSKTIVIDLQVLKN